MNLVYGTMKYWRVGVLVVLALVGGNHPGWAAPFATYSFGEGPVTFGMALPQGTAAAGVTIGALQTQTDVKGRWADGSIRFAVVSVVIPRSGAYPLDAAVRAASSTFVPEWPAIAVEFSIAGRTWTATPGSFSDDDAWLAGPVAREVRRIVRPVSGGTPHPLLEVVFDIRSYANGTHRIDFTVQNVRDSAVMAKVPVSGVSLTVNGRPVWNHGPVTSYSMTRWRHIQWVGAAEAAITPDFEPTFLSGALPRVLSSVRSGTYDVDGANYDVMGGRPSGGYPAIAYGEMNPDMATGGGRQEIGALNWWEAEYLVHKTPNQRAAVLRNADLTGAWSVHLAKIDGTMIKLGDAGYDPSQWWWDPRGPAGSRPLAALNPATGFEGAREGLSADTDTGVAGIPSRYNEEHVPAPMYLAYLLSGDRFYVDQAKFWAACAILKSAPAWQATDPVNFPGWFRGRNGSTGNERILDFTGMTREFGWPLRLVGYAAWMMPDTDPDRPYLLETVQNNLNHVGEYLDLWQRLGYGGALGAIGGAETPSGWNLTRAGQTTGRYTSLWRLAYTTYAVDWCTRQGLWKITPSIEAFVNRVVNLSITLNIQNPKFLNGEAAMSYQYYPVFNTMANGVFTKWFNTFAELKTFNETYQYTDDPTPGNPWWNKAPAATGYYNAEHHMMLQIGVRRGLPNAQAAAERLAQVPGHRQDLDGRAGFAITFAPTPSANSPVNPPAGGSTTAAPGRQRVPPPSAPSNVTVQ